MTIFNSTENATLFPRLVVPIYKVCMSQGHRKPFCVYPKGRRTSKALILGSREATAKDSCAVLLRLQRQRVPVLSRQECSSSPFLWWYITVFMLNPPRAAMQRGEDTCLLQLPAGLRLTCQLVLGAKRLGSEKFSCSWDRRQR